VVDDYASRDGTEAHYRAGAFSAFRPPVRKRGESDAEFERRVDYERRKFRLRRQRMRLGFVLLYPLAFLVAGIVAMVVVYPEGRDELLEYAVVGAFGGLVGVGELISRYRDAPRSAIFSSPAIGYIAINSLAAFGALFLIFRFDWTFGATGDAILPTQLLVASFGSIALFRTSLFTVRAGNEDVGIGPSSLLTVMLGACDRAVDRVRAKDRGFEVAYVMGDVSFDAAEGPLPAVALALMQNLPEAEIIALSTEVERLRHQENVSDRAKALLLGLAITNRVGIDVLTAAKKSLGPEILRAEIDEVPETAHEARAVSLSPYGDPPDKEIEPLAPPPEVPASDEVRASEPQTPSGSAAAPNGHGNEASKSESRDPNPNEQPETLDSDMGKADNIDAGEVESNRKPDPLRDGIAAHAEPLSVELEENPSPSQASAS
jgi:hypothetical protein